MKVIYKQRVSDKIIEAVANAKEKCEEVERVELTPNEFDRLKREADSIRYVQLFPGALSMRGHRHMQFDGVRVQDYEGGQ